VTLFPKSEGGIFNNGHRYQGVIPNNGSLKFGVARGKEEYLFSTVSGHVISDLAKFLKKN
jgi:hypothetical protein